MTETQTKPAARNPQEDPRNGDMVVCMGGKYRRVAQRHGNDIYYYQGVNFGQENQQESMKLKNCWITTWQDWCRKSNIRESHCATQ